MPTTTLDNTATQSTVQQYLDRLYRELKMAENDLKILQTTESKEQNDVSNKQTQVSLLDSLKTMLEKTNELGVAYKTSLGQMSSQGKKLGKNTSLGVRAIKVLLCQTKQVVDCIEVLRSIAKQLSDRISCKITGGGGPATIMGSLAALRKGLDESMTAVTDVVNSILAALQQQQDLWVSIAGTNGLVYQVEAMWSHLDTGIKKDLEDEASCHPRRRPIFPMTTKNFDFYDNLIKQHQHATAALNAAKEKLEAAKARRQAAQSKRDALLAAYTAASAAKAGGKK